MSLRTARPADVGLDATRLDDLYRITELHVKAAGLPLAQLAVARDGRVAALRTFSASGTRAPNGSLFTGYSTTKALTASAAWLLVQDGSCRLEDRVADHLESFGANGKGAVTVEQLLTHTAGFPNAVLPPGDWADPARRRARLASWALEWSPGSRFEYHATSSMWVIAALVEALAGRDFHEFVRERILRPLRLQDLLLGPRAASADVAPVAHVGDPRATNRLKSAGVDLPPSLLDEGYFETYNRADVRAVGVPSSGAVTTAAALALFYQGLLGSLDGAPWTPQTLAEATRPRTGDLLDPMTGRTANRAAGLVVAGDDDRVFRGFGATNSARAFGHAGYGGQIAWADPETGVSFAFLTSGLDRNTARLGLRMIALSTQAARTGQVRVTVPDRFELDRPFIRKMLPLMERFGRYFDADVRGIDTLPEGPMLLVGNHSGGALTPDTPAVLAAWYRHRGLSQPLVPLAFDAALNIPAFGEMIRKVGGLNASRENASMVLRSGGALLVYPGGDMDVFRPWRDRNRIHLAGRMGFVRLAIEHGVPVVPVVGHGGHETVVVLSRGETLARAMGLHRFRVGVCPIMLPAPPLPARITVQVGRPLDWSHYGAAAARDPAVVQRCYDEITGIMQTTMDALVEEIPRPLLAGVRRFLP